MLSLTVEYALRAVVWLADHPGSPQTTPQIAQAAQVPPDYLSKVLQGLGRAGLVQAQRGKHGGFTLAKPASTITILEVVNAVDPIRRIHSCPLGLSAHAFRLCALHQRLDDALSMVEKAFGDTTLADLLADPSPSRPLCSITEAAHA